MKHQLSVGTISLLLLTSCLHRIALGPDEQCAMRGMTLSQTTMSCTLPAPDPYQGCRLQAFQVAGITKVDYDPVGRNVLIGIGYMLYIVPGVVMYYAFDSSRDDIVQRTAFELAQRLTWCDQQYSRNPIGYAPQGYPQRPGYPQPGAYPAPPVNSVPVSPPVQRVPSEGTPPAQAPPATGGEPAPPPP